MAPALPQPGFLTVWSGRFGAALAPPVPAADEEEVAHALWRVRDQFVRQFLRGLCREEARMRVGEPVQLLAHGSQHIRMRMAETRHRRAARGIDVFLPSCVPDGDAMAARGDGIVLANLTMKDMGHGYDGRS